MKILQFENGCDLKAHCENLYSLEWFDVADCRRMIQRNIYTNMHYENLINWCAFSQDFSRVIFHFVQVYRKPIVSKECVCVRACTFRN